MAPSGPPHDAAARAASRREPIILPGFDRRRQLDIDFRTVPFGASWLRRMYTNEQHRHVVNRTRSDEARLQEVRYGNNMTVLINACLHLQRYYDSHAFWPAISQGFGASARVVRDMVELLVDARDIYRRHSVAGDVDPVRSGATSAADRWIEFLDRRRGSTGTGWCNEQAQDSGDSVHSVANEFFKEAEGRQVDKAMMLPKEVDRQDYSPFYSRKRFASPEPPGRPPSPKRRPSSNYSDRVEPLSTRPSQLLTSLSTSNIQIRGTARQDYQTPITASERSARAKSPAHDFHDEDNEVLREIRNIAAETKNCLSSIDNRDLTPNHAASNGSSDIENRNLRDRVAVLEKELLSFKSSLPNDKDCRSLVNAILSEHGLSARITSLERNAAEAAERHAQELKDVKDSIKGAKDEVAFLSGNLTKKKESTPSHHQDLSHVLRDFANVQGRLSSLEVKLAISGTKFASLESEVSIIQSQPQGSSVSFVEEVNDRLTRLEDWLTVKDALKENDRAATHEMRGKMQKLEDEVNSIGKRVTRVEAEPGEGEHFRELESRIAVNENQHDSNKEHHTTKEMIEARFKELDDRLAHERDAAAEISRDINQRLMTTETLGLRLSKIIDVPRTSKSPSPSQNAQQNMDQMYKTTNSLPTEAYVTHMILKHEQVSKSENDRLQQALNDMSIQMKALPTATSVSDMIYKRERILKADVGKLQGKLDEMTTKIDSLPNIAYISERIFHLEHSLRAELERYQQDVKAVVDGSKKDLETLQAQVKGLNKLWNEAATGVAKNESLLALKVEVDVLKGLIAIQSKKADAPKQDMEAAQDKSIADLDRRVTDLSNQVSTALSELTPEIVMKRLEAGGVRNKADAPAIGNGRIDTLALDIETLYDRVTMLARALSGIGQLIGPT